MNKIRPNIKCAINSHINKDLIYRTLDRESIGDERFI